MPLKKTTYPEKQDSEEVKKEREQFIKDIEEIDISKLVALDESSVNLAFSRSYGRASKSGRVKEGIKDVRFERKSILSTVRLNGEMCPLVFSGTLNKELFSEYIKTQLEPSLADDDILLLDHSSVHKSQFVLDTLAACKIRFLFLPCHSPDFNPIELLWAYVKSMLRKFKAGTHEKLEQAVSFALRSVPPSFISNGFGHCGYVV